MLIRTIIINPLDRQHWSPPPRYSSGQCPHGRSSSPSQGWTPGSSEMHKVGPRYITHLTDCDQKYLSPPHHHPDQDLYICFKQSISSLFLFKLKFLSVWLAWRSFSRIWSVFIPPRHSFSFAQELWIVHTWHFPPVWSMINDHNNNDGDNDVDNGESDDDF